MYSPAHGGMIGVPRLGEGGPLSTWFGLLARIPLILLICILPLGVAGQNIGSGVIGLMLLALIWVQRHQLPLAEAWRLHKVYLLTVAAYMMSQVVATRFNAGNPDPSSLQYLNGHIIWAIIPAAVYLGQPRLTPRDWNWLLWTLAAIALILGGMATSQAIWGWKLQQAHVVWGFPRAQGLYSHPMSFGYVCLLFVPLACLLIQRWPRHPAVWLLAVSIVAAILASRSRMVEAVSTLVVFFNIWTSTRGRLRVQILGAATLITGLILVTPNPVGERFRGMLVRADVHGDYADDREAFWQVNWQMVLERPLLGHGEGLTTKYRIPYYVAQGLGDFPRLYEAHNMFLQAAVNGGLLGLGILLAWFGNLFLAAWRARQAGLYAGRVMLQTLTAFCLAGLTQNAFQDSAVRYVLTLAVTAFWLALQPLTSLGHQTLETQH